MIEVLITVVVLSIGLLGLAGMQLRGVQDNQRAMHRSVATMLAYDMADRMRANRDAVADYDGINGPASDPGCVTSGCTAAQMAQYDAYEWGTTVASALPAGLGQVSDLADGNGTYEVRVMWDEERSGATGTDCGEGDLKCFILDFRP